AAGLRGLELKEDENEEINHRGSGGGHRTGELPDAGVGRPPVAAAAAATTASTATPTTRATRTARGSRKPPTRTPSRSAGACSLGCRWGGTRTSGWRAAS